MSEQQSQESTFDVTGEPPESEGGGGGVLGLGLVVLGTALLFAVFISGLVPGLSPAALAPPAPPTPDPFHEVRLESQAAFERGQRHYQNGELDLALIELDRAKLHDPENRPEIQALLDSTVSELRRRADGDGPGPTATPSRPVPTPTPFTVVLPKVLPVAKPSLPASPTSTPPTLLTPRVQLHNYQDAQQGFSVDVPFDWRGSPKPEAEAGVGIVRFHPSQGSASFVVSIDVVLQQISPELYAAHLETRMGSLPGYTSDGVAPTLVNGAPALRRQFTVRRSAESEAMRTIQVVLGGRSAMFILTGTATASEFATTGTLFDEMIKSFRVSSSR